MNKKIVSFVLAMVLSIGLGVVNVFADSYSDYAAKFNSAYANSTEKGSVKIKVGSASDELKGNLTGVFSYYAGTMVSYFAAGGNYSIYDSYGARFSASNAGNIWTLTSVNLRYSDYANMPKLSDYLNTDEDGNYATETTETTKYYKVVYKKLSGYKDKDGNEITVAAYKKLSDEDKNKYSAVYNGKEISAGDYDNLTEEEKANYVYSKTEITKEEYDQLKKSEDSKVDKVTYVKYTKDYYQYTAYSSVKVSLWKAYKELKDYTFYKDKDGKYITKKEWNDLSESDRGETGTMSVADAAKLSADVKKKLVSNYEVISEEKYNSYSAEAKANCTVTYSTSEPEKYKGKKIYKKVTENFSKSELTDLIKSGQVTSDGKTALKLDSNGNIKTDDFKNNGYKEEKITEKAFQDKLDKCSTESEKEELKRKWSKETKELLTHEYKARSSSEKKFCGEKKNKVITKAEYEKIKKDNSGKTDAQLGLSKTSITEDEWKKLSVEDRGDYKREETRNKSKVTSETRTETHYSFKSDKAKAAYVAAMKEFLLSLGFTESQLSVAKMDEDGNLLDKNGNKIKYSDDDQFDSEVGMQDISADWFVELGQQLAKGVNCSATVSIGTGMTGPSLTVSENGKAQLVYQTNPSTGECRPTTQYCYNDDGFLYQIVSATFEIEKSEDGYAEGHWNQTVTDITYSSTGVRTDKTYELYSWPKTEQERRDAIASAILPDNEDAEVSADIPCYLVSETRYTNTGSTNYSYDYKTNNKTFYANGKPSYTINEKGVEVAVYQYSANGVIQAYYNAEGQDAKGETVGTTTVYDKWGRALFTAKTGSANQVIGNDTERAKLMAEYYDGIASGSFSRDSSIVGFYLYADSLLNKEELEKAGMISDNGFINIKGLAASSYNSRFFNPNLSKMGYTQNDVINMLKFNNGSAAVAYTTIDTAANFTDEDKNLVTADDVSSSETTVRTSGGTHDYNSIIDKKVAKKGITYNNTIFLGGAQAYSKEYKVVTEIKTTVVQESDPVVEGNLFPEVTDEELEAAGIDPKDEKAVAEYKQQKIEKMAVDLGIGEYDENGNFVIKDGEESAYEDLKKGFYTDKTTGKTYALVNASTINIMDGSGFQAAVGETVFVEIDEATKTSILENGSTRIMFMGDVRPSVATDSTGKQYLTMAMNTSYGGGVVQGETAVQNAKNEIFLASMGAALNNGADIQTIQQQINDYNAANGTDYSAADATSAYNEAKDSNSPNNWVVQNTNVNMKIFNNQNYDYRAGWALLLGNSSINVNLEEDFVPALF